MTQATAFRPKTAWQTLEKVTLAPLKKGDNVLFRRGMLGQYGANGVCEPEVMVFEGDVDSVIWKVLGDAEGEGRYFLESRK